MYQCLPALLKQSMGDVVSDPDEAVPYCRVKNSEFLRNFDQWLSHLDVARHNQLAGLIKRFPYLFGDIPMHVIEHDIDIRDSEPLKQRFYPVHPQEQKFLDAENKYMLENKIAEPSGSS